MITPNEVRQKALKLWESPHFLRAFLERRDLFPWDISFSKPAGGQLSEKFNEVRDWILALRSGSKEALGYGYSIKYSSVNHRRLGKQILPKRIFIESAEDFLKLTGKQKEFARFKHTSSMVLDQWPQLGSFFAGQPHLVLDCADRWGRLLAVCRYFMLNPRPSIYMRQLDIPGVDTKFIETNKKILADLLDVVLPLAARDTNIKGLSNDGFERRFGLRCESPMVRFRMLDSKLSINGLTDMSIPVTDFERLELPVQRIFIIENKVNGLCFPDCPASMAIFGLGYGIGILSNVKWFKNATIFYWGDIDTHGFSIFDLVRSCFPEIKSFLMDRTTLGRFKNLWGQEDISRRFNGRLEHLDVEDRGLFEELRDNRTGERVRLEQERISYSYLVQKLAEVICQA